MWDQIPMIGGSGGWLVITFASGLAALVGTQHIAKRWQKLFFIVMAIIALFAFAQSLLGFPLY